MSITYTETFDVPQTKAGLQRLTRAQYFELAGQVLHQYIGEVEGEKFTKKVCPPDFQQVDLEYVGHTSGLIVLVRLNYDKKGPCPRIESTI